MAERQLSNEEIKALDINEKPIIPWGHDDCRKGDRRKALFSYVEPAMDRRSGIDRRRV